MDLRHSVCVDVPAVGIQGARHIHGQHMPRPGWILEPRQFGCPFVDRDQVFLPIFIKVRCHKLIAKLNGLGDDMFTETRQFTSRKT